MCASQINVAVLIHLVPQLLDITCIRHKAASVIKIGDTSF